MTTEDQKSVNQLVHEAAKFVSDAKRSAAMAHEHTHFAAAAARTLAGGSDLLRRAIDADHEALLALVATEAAYDAIGRAEMRLAQTVPEPKPSDDGWIEWHGGECPVADDAVVDLRLRSGEEIDTGQPRMWRWTDKDYDFDIVAYRLHKPAALAEAQAEIERLREALDTEKREHEGIRDWSKSQADQILELIEAHNKAAAQYNEAQAECAALKRENAERKLSELQAAHDALQQAHQDAVQQLASRNHELANLRKFIS